LPCLSFAECRFFHFKSWSLAEHPYFSFLVSASVLHLPAMALNSCPVMLTAALLLLVCSSLVASSPVDAINSGLLLTEAKRTLDLTSQMVKANFQLTVKNEGSTPARTFHFSVDDQHADKVSYVGAKQGQTYLRVTPAKLEGKRGAAAWRLELKEPLSAGQEQKLEVDLLLGKALEMFPKEIQQRDKQLVLFNGNHYIYSPYKVKTQTTKVRKWRALIKT